MKEIIAEIRDYCENAFREAKRSHNWDHTERVYKLCMHIGKIENADLEVLAIAAFLHDIGRAAQDMAKGKVCHAEVGAAIAEDILNKYDIAKEKKDNIIHSVLCHRYRNSHEPATIEAKVLFDADKLDAIGAVGIARDFLFAGEIGAMLHNPHADPYDTIPYTKDDTGYREYVVKLSKIHEKMLTKEGRRMAEGRHAFMKEFFERFVREHEGEL
ncbi:MAG TPA: HD domain-containing protein [Desulfomonilia bacterium]